MPIDFVCPKCRTELETPEGTAGAVTHCPTCGVALIVPGAEGGSSSSMVAPTAPPDGEASEKVAAPSDSAERPPIRSSSELSSSGGTSLALTAGDAPESESFAQAEPRPSWTTRLFATVDDPPGDVFQLARPAPKSFSTPAALAYGARLMHRHAIPFSWANLVVVAVLSVAAVLSLATRFSVGFWGVFFVWSLLTGPLAAAGVAKLALRAARGRPVIVPEMFPSLGRVLRIWFYFVGWGFLMTLAIAPPLLGMWGAWGVGRKVEAVGLGLASILWTMLVGARLGWFPFVFCDQPGARFGELLRASLAVSRGQTVELMRLSLLVFAAIAGTNVAVVVAGLPLAMGVAGATYALLAREAASRGSWDGPGS